MLDEKDFKKINGRVETVLTDSPVAKLDAKVNCLIDILHKKKILNDREVEQLAEYQI